MSRSVKKGPFIEKSLYKKVIEMSKSGDRKMVKTYSRCSTIIPEMVGSTISVYNGKTWVNFGKKKAPNRWVTLRALKTLRAIQETQPAQAPPAA